MSVATEIRKTLEWFSGPKQVGAPFDNTGLGGLPATGQAERDITRAFLLDVSVLGDRDNPQPDTADLLG